MYLIVSIKRKQDILKIIERVMGKQENADTWDYHLRQSRDSAKPQTRPCRSVEMEIR